MIEKFRRLLEKKPGIYIGVVSVITILLIGILWTITDGFTHFILISVTIFLISLFPALELSISLINRFFAWFLQPRILPKMNFENGIPDHCRTMVVVPTMLTSSDNVKNQIEAIEVRALANGDPGLQFALLSDFPDADAKTLDSDGEILRTAKKLISDLNKKYKSVYGDKYILLHRERLWNENEKVWMGWERKRGKLEEFNRLLCDPKAETTYTLQQGEFISLLKKHPVRFVITLDADTKLPPEGAVDLVRTISHPLNRAWYDSSLKRIKKGYGIIQPRISIPPESARKTLFTKIFSGNVGLDPYSTAVSDIYQDLNGEAVFTGKGIYDVYAFHKVLNNRFPENRILSHDLIESTYLRAGLATDIELYDDYPSNYTGFCKRNHRWARGDWQIAAWLFPNVPEKHGKVKNPINLLSKWKIFDNLRRSLTPFFIVVFLAAGWFWLPGHAVIWTLAALGILAFPIYVTLSTDLANRPARVKWKLYLEKIRINLKINTLQFISTLIVLPHQAIILLDAAIKTIWRLKVTKKKLLEWVSFSHVEMTSSNTLQSNILLLLPSVILGVILIIVSLVTDTGILFITAPFAALWISAPYYVWQINKPSVKSRHIFTDIEKQKLRCYARRTWFYFERFMNEKHSWLPPDNYQSNPLLPVTNRTSPTNIGLGLTSFAVAYNMGYLTFGQMLNRIENTLFSLQLLERYNGHFFNWYETQTGEVLQPRYISTVDSGNLAAGLIVVKQAVKQEWESKGFNKNIWNGLHDTVTVVEEIFREHFEGSRIPGEIYSEVKFHADKLLNQISRKCPQEVSDCLDHLNIMKKDALKLSAVNLLPSRHLLGDELMENLLFWMESPLMIIESLKSEMECFSENGRIYSGFKSVREIFDYLKEIGKNNSGLKKIERWKRQKDNIIKISEQLIQEMDFTFLYLKKRKLFSIGYNADKAQLDEGTYDLLASEARIASYISIAKGEIPVDHWFKLGRRLTSLEKNEILLSWGGTMFEYLMPVMFMRSFPNTLLSHTYDQVVQWQREYAARRGLPWGQSESAYYFLNIEKHFQYRAFGAPGLGLKRGLAEDYVVAPYASFLALMIDPKNALKNLMKIEKMGGLGTFGFFDAVDFSPYRLKESEEYKIVHTYMAHHHGMSLLSLENILNGWKAHHYFHSDLQIKGCDLLLQERIPRGIPVKEPHPIEVELEPGEQKKVQRVVEHAGMDELDSSPPRLHILTNGRSASIVTHAGTGCSYYKDIALTEWKADAASDLNGLFFYIKDTDSGKFWSAGHQPVKRQPDRYDTWFHNGKIVTSRVDDWIETTTEVCVSSERNVELRRLTLTNYSDKVRTIEITSYAEIVLNRQVDHNSHPAFSRLFIQTEYLAENHAIIARRRPRSETDEAHWLVHTITTQELENLTKPLQFETERANFIGRGRNLENPAAMDQGHELRGVMGNVSDPIISLRKQIQLKPGEKNQVSFTLGRAETRDEAVHLATIYNNPETAERELNMSSVYSDIELEHLGITPKQAHYFQKLASFFIYPDKRYRASEKLLKQNRQKQFGLWAYGISGDVPLLVFRIDHSDQLKEVKKLLKAHLFWRYKGLDADLLILNDHPPGYADELHHAINQMIESSLESDSYHKKRDVYLLQSDKVTVEDEILILTVASAVFEKRLPDESNLRVKKECKSFYKKTTDQQNEIIDPEKTSPVSQLNANGLKFYNEFGGFSQDGDEYHIFIKPDSETGKPVFPPSPWINVISNKKFGFIATERGAGYTWSGNSRENKLTTWSNDPVTDPHSEAIYIRNNRSNKYWSPIPGPAPGSGSYKTIHGFGYTKYQHFSSGLRQELLQFVPVDDSVKINILTLENLSEERLSLSLFTYLEWVMGVDRIRSSRYVIQNVSESGNRLYAQNHYNNEFAGRTSFHTVSIPGSDAQSKYTTDRKLFIGRNRSLANPQAVQPDHQLDNKVITGDDVCAAFQTEVELETGDICEVIILTGEESTREKCDELIEFYSQANHAHEAFDEVKNDWKKKLTRIQVKTPDDSLDVMVNGWLMFQNLSSRMMARTAFYQAGGAYGFRDQLQDAMAALYVDPEITRNQILLHAERQFPEGDVQHWWHPPTGRGVRTKITDDRLWLPYVTAFYIQSTGDKSILKEEIPYIKARQLEEHEHEAYLEPEKSDITGSLYEHCCRAIEISLKFGDHGIPLMGSGDWNDGMNRVGEGGKGESVWLGFFLYSVLTEFQEICTIMGDKERKKEYKSQASLLKTNLNNHGWDGEWYLRAFYDDGTPLGSSKNKECRIDAISQSWAVISGAAKASYSEKGLLAVEQNLISEHDRIIRLLTPPFDRTEKNPGYIKGYIPGVRENGGQYTHGALWTIKAFAMAGNGNKAVRYLNMINPVNHGRTAADVICYSKEPYVVAADVYGEQPLTGTGGWTWYTGSAGWMYRVALESVLGFRLVNNEIVLEPVISSEWEEYEISYHIDDETIYRIKLRNPNRIERGKLEVSDAAESEVKCKNGLAVIPIQGDKKEHLITLEIRPEG
ncbi:MAG: GH36-type glycosyl hydrolase domain-containing protein [Balneolaceae bacterium]